ncbi:putative prophage repressor [Chromohalobacter israelensis DSM 3043]|uniref:Putative prophage repressor n=2 Tax=Chromohalobacter israelensis TaxID=141390 RepID=Q1QXP7_CHRI1|nr:putative prophage repressor [Chromohalobacter salexigens DSM 3043]
MAIDGDLTVKKLGTIGKRPYLLPGTPNYAPIPMEGRECHVWGGSHAQRACAPGRRREIKKGPLPGLLAQSEPHRIPLAPAYLSQYS